VRYDGAAQYKKVPSSWGNMCVKREILVKVLMDIVPKGPDDLQEKVYQAWPLFHVEPMGPMEGTVSGEFPLRQLGCSGLFPESRGGIFF
jgi:hypothetical protein